MTNPIERRNLLKALGAGIILSLSIILIIKLLHHTPVQYELTGIRLFLELLCSKLHYCVCICLNFANGDMVGHTGIYSAIEKAVKTVDNCVEKVVEKIVKYRVDLTERNCTAQYGW